VREPRRSHQPTTPAQQEWSKLVPTSTIAIGVPRWLAISEGSARRMQCLCSFDDTRGGESDTLAQPWISTSLEHWPRRTRYYGYLSWEGGIINPCESTVQIGISVRSDYDSALSALHIDVALNRDTQSRTIYLSNALVGLTSVLCGYTTHD